MTLAFPFPAAPLNDAVVSDDGLYRYRLSRKLGPGPRLTVALLNPSVACAIRDDHSWKKGLGFARRWGCGFLEYVNLFAFISTDPAGLATAVDSIGPDNDRHILEAARAADIFVVAWGTHGTFRNRDRDVLAMVRAAGVETLCLRVNVDGTPEHLARLPYALKPQAYVGRPDVNGHEASP